MLEKSTLTLLKGKKNLLAFSAGGDSTALFFLLLEHDICFDIAIVDYGIRAQSKEEVQYAKDLASLHNLKCHIHHSHPIEKNFEAKARTIRYDFFHKLIHQHHYVNLLTAHHLGDRFEWMLMQFCKGAGAVELAGMNKVQKRDTFQLVRPLLHLDKQELLHYLDSKKIRYFEDESNQNTDIKRNAFRHNYATPLLRKYRDGIQKSFEYLDEDKELLTPYIELHHIGTLTYFASNTPRANIYTIDKHLKSLGYMASAKEKMALKSEETSVLGRKFVVNKTKKYIFITPFINSVDVMDKEFKEQCRVLKIPIKLRTYLFQNQEAFTQVKKLLS